MRQFIAVKFNEWSKRTYTYHHDGEPIAVGDEVKVSSFDGDGWQRVKVVALVHEEPDFPTKPIIGRIDPDQPDLLNEGE
jgi:hypothetical protein